MKHLVPLFLFFCAAPALAVPGAKRNLGTIVPKPNAAAAAQREAQSLGDSYALVGTISCDSCASPFQPVAVVRDLTASKLLHLRVGDEVQLRDGEYAVVTVIGSGSVDFKGSRASYRLRAGGFPDETISDDGKMIATKPNGYIAPPNGSVPTTGVRW